MTRSYRWTPHAVVIQWRNRLNSRFFVSRKYFLSKFHMMTLTSIIVRLGKNMKHAVHSAIRMHERMINMKCSRSLVDHLKKKNGFSLVEIMISLIIILLITVAISPLIVLSAQNNQYNRSVFVAKNLANERIEEIRSMDFAHIGVAPSTSNPHPNPQGTIIEFEENISIDGRSFNRHTMINWADQGGCLSGLGADWDVKIVRVVVTGNDMYRTGSTTIEEEVHTLISRDSEQPVMTGANIRVCVFRGWNYDSSTTDFMGNPVAPENRDYVPVNSVPVQLLNTSNSLLTTLFSNNGAVLFAGISEGNYSINISPLNMIIRPGSFPQNVSATNNVTTQEFAFVEFPGTLAINVRDLFNNSVVINLTGSPGEIVLQSPFESNTTFTFNSTNTSGRVLPLDLLSGLWPIPEEYGPSYALGVTLPGYLITPIGVWDPFNSQPWQGYFDAPGVEKNLEIYVWEIPTVTENTNADSWLRAASGNIHTDLDLLDRISYDDDTLVLQPGLFNRTKQNNDLSLPANEYDNVKFAATDIVFRGENLDIGNHSTLDLTANYFSFENEILLSNTSTIVFNVLRKDSNNHLLWPGNDAVEIITTDESVDPPIEVASFISVPNTVNPVILGANISFIGFDGLSSGSSYGSTEYGIIYFEKDVRVGTSGNNNLLIESGAYYFPNGFDLRNDGAKEPDDGGLIKIAE